MANEVVSWDAYWTVDRALYQTVNLAVYGAANPALYEAACRNVDWAVDDAVDGAMAPLEGPFHPGVALYLGSGT